MNQELTKKQIDKTVNVITPAITITSAEKFHKRLWNIIKNPFTYLYNGTIEW